VLRCGKDRTVTTAYPNLSAKDIRAALSYAADTVAHEEIVLDPADSDR
jgi:uncharacterized protein (DUF433 family)